MSLEQILEEIIAEGEAKVQTIRAETQAEVQRISEEAEKEAAILEERAANQETAKVGAETQRILQKARLQALEAENFASQTVVQQAIEQVRQSLVHVRSDSHYPYILKNLLQESLNSFQQPGLDSVWVIQADERDRKLLENDLGIDKWVDFAGVDYSLVTSGGIIVMDSEQRMFIDNTLERRLERAETFLRQVLPEDLVYDRDPAVGRDPAVDRDPVPEGTPVAKDAT